MAETGKMKLQTAISYWTANTLLGLCAMLFLSIVLVSHFGCYFNKRLLACLPEYEVKPAKTIVSFNCRLSVDLDVDTCS